MTVSAYPTRISRSKSGCWLPESAAIRGAQADTVRYPEFVKRCTRAGVIGYWAFLTGKRVIYFGRKGEQHIEEFPKPKA